MEMEQDDEALGVVHCLPFGCDNVSHRVMETPRCFCSIRHFKAKAKRRIFLALMYCWKFSRHLVRKCGPFWGKYAFEPRSLVTSLGKTLNHPLAKAANWLSNQPITVAMRRALETSYWGSKWGLKGIEVTPERGDHGCWCQTGWGSEVGMGGLISMELKQE